jgi:type VI secretion system secreted protein VgrG
MLGLYDHSAHGEVESFHAIAQRANVQTGAVKLTDYNFETPKAMMETADKGKASHPHGKLESFEFPGGYPDAGRGRTVAQTRLAQVRQGASMFNGAGNVASLRPGMKVKFEAPPGKALPDFLKSKTFICLGASYDVTGDQLGDGSQSDDGSAPFLGSFTFLDAADGIVPTRRTPPARVLGPQTAEVVGSGDIDCDEHGRILVRFHWDLADAKSMRCRVSQNWAGKGWGGMVIPRVGMEVIVQFLNGDPDCPIVTGCVYNGDNTVPEGLPDAKTRSIFRSNSSGGDGFNELAFEDQAGEELVYFHAQKDHTLEILNDRKITVGHDQIETIDNDKTSTVIGNHTEDVKKSVEHKVGQSLKQRVGNDMEIKTITYELNGTAKTTIIGGGSKIELSPGMVTITAPVIRLAGKVIMG